MFFEKKKLFMFFLALRHGEVEIIFPLWIVVYMI